MRYAIISDIHGNFNALNAAIKDAEQFNIDKYIFVGDYFASLHFPNEVIGYIKSLNNAYFVQGNEEMHFSEYGDQDQSTWTDGQFQIMYWLYRTVTVENRRFLSSIPKTLQISDDFTNIFAAHSSCEFIGNIELDEFSAPKISIKYKDKKLPLHEIILADIRGYLSCNSVFKEKINSLLDGVYIFGHSHVQWNAQYGKKLFINPGSCGLPLDGEQGAAYTILEIKSNSFSVIERRIKYDIDELIYGLRNSSLYEQDEVWGNIIIKTLITSFEHASLFLNFVENYAHEIHDYTRPFSVKTWTEAYKSWSMI
jgi:predicted phosphodiesterase